RKQLAAQPLIEGAVRRGPGDHDVDRDAAAARRVGGLTRARQPDRERGRAVVGIREGLRIAGRERADDLGGGNTEGRDRVVRERLQLDVGAAMDARFAARLPAEAPDAAGATRGFAVRRAVAARCALRAVRAVAARCALRARRGFAGEAALPRHHARAHATRRLARVARRRRGAAAPERQRSQHGGEQASADRHRRVQLSIVRRARSSSVDSHNSCCMGAHQCAILRYMALDFEHLGSDFIRALRGSRSQAALSRRLGFRTNVLYAWESGRRWPTAELRFPDFLRLFEGASLRVLDFVALFHDPNTLPSAAPGWEALQAHRRAVYEFPWISAVLGVLELAEYTALPRHPPGWIAQRLGIPREEEQRCLDVLERSGQIVRKGRRWQLARSQTGDTRQDPAAERQRKQWWAELGVARLRAGAPGQFSFNVFAVSRAD